MECAEWSEFLKQAWNFAVMLVVWVPAILLGYYSMRSFDRLTKRRHPGVTQASNGARLMSGGSVLFFGLTFVVAFSVALSLARDFLCLVP